MHPNKTCYFTNVKINVLFLSAFIASFGKPADSLGSFILYPNSVSRQGPASCISELFINSSISSLPIACTKKKNTKNQGQKIIRYAALIYLQVDKMQHSHNLLFAHFLTDKFLCLFLISEIDLIVCE